MADYNEAFEKMLSNEGGYRLTNIKGDLGGQTYAGISRSNWPNWSGWERVDNEDMSCLPELVKNFYRIEFWNKIKGEEIKLQRIAENIFDFAVNVGVTSCIKKAQTVMNLPDIDGIIGKQTLSQLNLLDSKFFCAVFTIEKISYYTSIINKNKTQAKFLLGWVNRAIKMWESK